MMARQVELLIFINTDYDGDENVNINLFLGHYDLVANTQCLFHYMPLKLYIFFLLLPWPLKTL